MPNNSLLFIIRAGMAVLCMLTSTTSACAEKSRAQLFKEMTDPSFKLQLQTKPTRVSTKEISTAKRSLTNQLVDPSSVQWGEVYTPMSVTEEQYVGGVKKFRVLCGTANAKNRMGGYNGFSYWLAIDYGSGFKVMRFGGGAEMLCDHYGALSP